MSWPALALAVPPTSRAVAWTPLLAVSATLLVVAALARAIGGSVGPLPLLAVASLAAIVLDAAHDPAERLLAPLPVPAFTRRLLRAVLVAIPATVALVVVTRLLPGASEDLLLPGLALTLSGLALATWLPPGREVRLAAALPVAWVSTHLLIGDTLGTGGAAAGWWLTDPVEVCVVASVLIALGSRR